MKKIPIALVTTFIWIGFIGAISFMEAWLKFQAENMTLAVGLSVGRIIFDALNKMEWLFAFLIVLSHKKQNIYLFVPILILIAQSYLLLPAMNERVELVLQGKELSNSYLHFYYLLMEVIKVGCLFTFGIKTFKEESQMKLKAPA